MAADHALFGMALEVMGDIYSSVLGTTVVRHREVPARPAHLDGMVTVLVEAGSVLDGAGGEAELKRTLGLRHDEGATFEEGRWLVQFASHSRAEAVVAWAGEVAGVAAISTVHNGRPYEERGWTTFESAVSTEALARVVFFNELQADLPLLPPKLVEIDEEEPREAKEAAGGPTDEGMGPRIEHVRASIREATFTIKGDKDIVLGLYGEYITNVMVWSGEEVAGVYEGEYNAAGLREGRGTFRYASGNVYEGDWMAGQREGRGTYRYANGDVYEGEWKAGEQEGHGTFRSADGDVYEGEWQNGKEEGRGTIKYAEGIVEVGFYKQGVDVGEGVRWSADGLRAWRLQDGQRVEAISPEEARDTAQRLSLPIPGVVFGASPAALFA